MSAAALGASAEDLAAVEAIVRRAGTSFYRGMRILPPDRRAAMYAIYAFCREVDDIADDPAPLADRLPRLAAWRARVAGLAEGRADGPVTRVLAAASARYGLRADDFLAVIDGMQMDAETAIVAPDLATLDLYCDRVAAAVGRLSVRAFGDGSAAADAVAHALGRALQLTNILRDIAEDAARGRLYLPREWLEAEGVPLDPEAALRAPGLARVAARLGAEAARRFAEAEAAMARCDARAMRPARMMAASYRLILTAMERRGWERAAERVRVAKWRKVMVAVRFMVG
ncbi:MAG: presqualene diphosphate synthase HpnD [Rhodospirillales bacterium]|nr:presqualene diphosphate synthase HpnD [Rhodospirillales bacterium]